MTSERSLIILHASVTGTALDLASRLALKAHRLGFSPKVQSISLFPPASLLTTEVPIVFLLPTTGNGTAPPTFLPLWNALLHPELPNDFLEDLDYAVFGLGDSSYPKYNWVAKKFTRRMHTLGAREVVERGEGDDQNEFGVESTFPQWSNKLFERLQTIFPPPLGFKPLDDASLPPPSVVFEDATSASLSLKSSALDSGSTSKEYSGECRALEWAEDCKWARLSRNERVTRKDWWQDVREIEIEVEDQAFSYTPGDVLKLRPENDAEEVQRFIETLGWEKEADELRTWRGRDQAHPLPPHFPSPFRASIRSLLTTELDISSVPKVGVFEWLSCFATQPREAQESTLQQTEDDDEVGEKDMAAKLKEFASPEGQDDLNDYALRPRRTLTEVLYEFKRVLHKRIPIEYALDWIPSMRSRGFSISSSPSVHSGQRIQLLVAIVRYKTNLSVERRGVATRWIEDLPVGSRFPIRIDRTGQLRLPPSLPPSSSTSPSAIPAAPLIMVGPGTGVAPFRALIEERTRQGIRDNLLFFGCRSLTADAHYHRYFTELAERGLLDYSIAASRDQEEKIYVQHRLVEHGEKVANWLSDERGGFLYICGSSTAMPRAVKKAVLSVLRTQDPSLTEEAAESRWDELERQGRIREEVWG
ncbi:NAPDH-dependent diflavin reductase [Sporobolomyces salmoneus]|uniref:NAPDH-dependent diflavin reductase n=1 Tax=Sporobolomyces salmoneus TaxID=183962 RepID=UPI0031780BEA